MPISVSLIICSYNRPAQLRATIEMAMAMAYLAFEIIVVDQTATNPPDHQAYFDALPTDRVRYYRRTEANLPAARNYGLAKAQGDLVLFIDDDVQIPPTFIEQHVAAHQRATTNAEIPLGGVSGIPLSPRHPSWESVAHNLAVQGVVPGLQRGDSVTVPWLTGCNMSFPRVVLAAVGGFDPYFTGSAWGEDVDISLAIRAKGYRLVMDTGIDLFHEMATEGGGESRSPQSDHTRKRDRTGFWLYLLCKHWRTLGVSNTLWRGWRLYREYAGSLALYKREGWREVAGRHREFVLLTYKAVHARQRQRAVL